ncbi:MAG: C40 family peptidase [Flavobacteriia bacterium]|nr:C40 family peptidase [Flavobacteriia bacterium]
MKFQALDQKHAFCLVSVSPLRKEPKDSAEMISQLLFGEIVKIHSILGPWVEVTTLVDDYKGFVDSKHLLPLSDEDTLNWQETYINQQNINKQITTPWGNQTISCGSFIGPSPSFKIGDYSFDCPADAKELNRDIVLLNLINTPYLWGGKSSFGIDCSGLSQLFFRLSGINLPRDAYQQAEIGTAITFGNHQKNDLAFFENKDGKIIHVGIIQENNKIIHASGRVRIDGLDETGIFNTEINQYTHFLSFIKKIN